MPDRRSAVHPEAVEGLSLICHPDTPAHLVAGVEVFAELTSLADLWVRYYLDAPVDDLALPDPAEPVRMDGLWQHTCCEIFLRRVEGDGYIELNFSPSSQWAAYAFADYRADARDLDLALAPGIALDASASHLALEAQVALPADWQAGALIAGLSAVIEEKDGTKSYWALAHPPGKPDFHHPDCFALSLGAPDAT
jgi:hypothetical protein